MATTSKTIRNMRQMILRTILTFLALTSFGMGVKAQVEMPLISDAPQNGNWAANTTWYQISLKKNGYLSSNANNSGYLMKVDTPSITKRKDLIIVWECRELKLMPLQN